MAAPIKAWEMANESGNFRNPTIGEPPVFGGPHSLNTPVGTVRTRQQIPPLPPPLAGNSIAQHSYGLPSYGGLNRGMGMGNYNMMNYGMGSYGASGLGATGYSGYNGYGRMGMGMSSYTNPMDPENRFIQIAEESSRPAFQSIESLVSAIGNIAMMLDSTFFALTSSFRAILGVAANFGRMRSLFAQFWTSFALFRSITYLYRKLMFILKLSKDDPKSMSFTEAFNTAANQNAMQSPMGQLLEPKKTTAWPMMMFIGFIFSAPYLIMKILGTVSTTTLTETKNPQNWTNPIFVVATHDFQATNPQELSFRAGQRIVMAPKEIQITHKLLSTGWALATVDNQSSGIIPINYVHSAPPSSKVTFPSPEFSPGHATLSDFNEIPEEHFA